MCKFRNGEEISINYYLALRFIQHVGTTIYSTETSKCLMTVKEVSYFGGRTSSFGWVGDDDREKEKAEPEAGRNQEKEANLGKLSQTIQRVDIW